MVSNLSWQGLLHEQVPVYVYGVLLELMTDLRVIWRAGYRVWPYRLYCMLRFFYHHLLAP